MFDQMHNLHARNEMFNAINNGMQFSRLMNQGLPMLNPITSLSSMMMRLYSNLDVNSSDLPADVTTKYEIGQKLGIGAFGTVYVVLKRDESKEGISYAMKVIRREKSDSGSISKEAELMTGLKHPNVVRLFDLIETPHHSYLIMEHMRGGTLQSRLGKIKKFDSNSLKVFGYQMLNAIKYIHGKGIVHRDLKPENILLASNDEYTILKITDFGSSKKSSHVMATGCGTAHYAAPEVFNPFRMGNTYTNKVDIWSLGVVLYECLTGQLAFPSLSAVGPQHTLFEGQFWAANYREKVLLAGMLKMSPHDRFSINEICKLQWMRTEDVWKIIRSLREKNQKESQ